MVYKFIYLFIITPLRQRSKIQKAYKTHKIIHNKNYKINTHPLML